MHAAWLSDVGASSSKEAGVCNDAYVEKRIKSFTCPVDTPAALLRVSATGGTFSLTNHNYAVNYGNTNLYSSDELLSFFMGKNTPERQDFIIDNLRVEKDLVEA